MHDQLMHELAEYVGRDGLSPVDLLSLPDGLRRIVTWLMRRGGVNPAELASECGCDAAAATALAEVMAERGLLHISIAPDGTTSYSTRMTRLRSRGRGLERLYDLFDD